MDPLTVVGLLADPTRMRVLAAIALGVSDDLPAKEAAIARRRLADAGLVVQRGPAWEVDYEALRDVVREAAEPQPQDGSVPTDLRAFLRGTKLLGLPAQRGRRLQLLEILADRTFEPGQLYTEAEVNELLKRWCENGPVDHVTIRRYLIDERLLVRGDGVYQVPSPDSSPAPNLGELHLRSMGLS